MNSFEITSDCGMLEKESGDGFFLTIFGEPCYYPSALTGKEPATIRDLSVITELTKGKGQNVRKNTSFFDDCYEELARAQSTGSRSDINRLLCKAMVPLKRYSVYLATRFPNRYFDPDDYVQEGLIKIVKYLEVYRYICPECEVRFKQTEDYINHCIENHGETLKPVQEMKRYISYMVKRFIFNMIRDTLRDKRASHKTVSYSDDVFDGGKNATGRWHSEFTVLKKIIFSEGNDPSQYDTIKSKARIEKVQSLIAEESNERIRYFVNHCLRDEEASEIWAGMVEHGLAASPNSARLNIHYYKGRPDLRKYREALTG